MKSAGGLETRRSTHIINIAVRLLNILDIMRDASIILLLVTIALNRIIFEIKLWLIAL